MAYETKHKLQDEIYLNDTRLRLEKLNRIENIFDDALNVVWYEIYEKNRKSSKMINICKHKNIGKYISKLEDIIINKIKIMKKINVIIICAMYDIKNKTNMVNEKIHKSSAIDNDTLHLIDNNLDEFITYLNNKLKISKKKKNRNDR